MLTRRVTFRLYPTRQQEDTLHYWRKLHCNLYNAAVYNRKTQYQKFSHSVSYFEQQNSLPAFKEVWTEYKPLGSHALQATLKRVDFAFNRFFKGLGGYPKFKSELCGGILPPQTSRSFSPLFRMDLSLQGWLESAYSRRQWQFRNIQSRQYCHERQG